MTKKTLSTNNEKITPVQFANSELTIHLRSPEERKKIEERRLLEEQQRIDQQKANEEHNRKASKQRVRVLIGIWILVGIYLFATTLFVFPKNKPAVQNISPNISFTYIAPKYLAIGDDNVIEITLSNTNSSEPFNGILTLVFSDPNISMTAVPNKRMSILVEELLPGDRLTEQFKFKLASKPPSDSIRFYFLLSLPDKSQHKSSEEQFLVSPIPGIRSGWSWVTGASGLIGLSITLLFERFRNLIGAKK